MQEIMIRCINKIRLNSFHPLCKNEFGLKAINDFSLPPFIDSSCRREPDFQNKYPSITALCRNGSFAPHLNIGDIIVYITVKGNYPNKKHNKNHHRLVAILKVIEKFNNHCDAASWYRTKKLQIPSNCMIKEVNPKSFNKTASCFKTKNAIRRFLEINDINTQNKIGSRLIYHWDKNYKSKSERWGNFLITEPIFKNLNHPPIIFTCDFMRIFNRVPRTQMPNYINLNQLNGLSGLAELKIINDCS